MRRVLIILAAVLLVAGCGSAEPPAAPTTAPPDTAVSSAAPEPSAGSELIKVPDVVGKNHQLAQDLMQAAGLYNLAEEDATGANRLLIIDRNWVVVRQSPKAGERVPQDTVVTLSSKKIGE